MSALLDSVLGSDTFAAGTPSSQHLRPNEIQSSSRPRPAPSESNGNLMSEADLFPEDEIVGRARRSVFDRDVPKVIDKAGDGVQQAFLSFLESHVEETPASGIPPSSELSSDKYYINQVHGLREFGLSTLYVDYRHVLAYREGPLLADAIASNYYRFEPFLRKAMHNLIAKHEPAYYREHRQTGSGTSQAGAASLSGNATSSNGSQGESILNPQTDKIFALAFYNLPLISRVRQLRTDQIGRLLSISGTVTRTSEVRPELSEGTFICEACDTLIPNIEQTFRYTEPTICLNKTCGNKTAWRLNIANSTFVDWQKCRIQENSSEIPTGSMPRTIDVILRGEQVERTKPGEKCIFTGTLLVVPDVSQLGIPGVRAEASSAAARNFRGANDAGGSGVSGLKALGVKDLTYRMAFMACFSSPDTSTPGQTANTLTGQSTNILNSLNQVDLHDAFSTGPDAQEAYLETLTRAEIEDLKLMVHSERIYSRLVNSLAPMIYGHEIIKKGLLLQLLGGVSKCTPEGMPLRGDINICIVGDPSTSKSQFLKYVSSFLPRAVYTSGKASSAAGLTAAVVKDEETGEHTIEAGALMLSDSGTCCIDEFDKMDIVDQVAIHEAMEQQTISIAKAGIHATLNARTSILAAANPVGGRYNRKATLRANINMSAPIMSRFDLFFVVLDECNENVDRHLADHIVNLHMLKDDSVDPEFSTEQLQRYVRFARTFKPVFTPESKKLLVQRYKELRANDAGGATGAGRNSYRITVRQLESLIRLSEAIAKANCVDEVTEIMVEEAFGLLKMSIISVEYDDVEIDEEDEEAQPQDSQPTGQTPQEGDSPMAEADGDDETGRTQAEQNSRPRTKISAEKYNKMRNLFIQRLATAEVGASRDDGDDEAQDDEDSNADADDGLSLDDLTIWYMEQIESELGTEEDLQAEILLCRKVLKKMEKNMEIMAIAGHGLREDSEDDRNAQSSTKYVLHPNVSLEDS